MKLNCRTALGGIIFAPLLFTSAVVAQITPDRSIGTHLETLDNRALVTGGALAGTNLFHSFREFSIPTGGIVHFNNPTTVSNIINRVTGTSISRIDGTIGANGKANVFLINPNGIVFGANARLNIGGSFLASTANSIQFADGSEFNALNTDSPVLSVSVPIGLQFGIAPREIINQANNQTFNLPNLLPIGLQVPFGQTIALVGGNVELEGGNLTAYGGRVAIGSVGDNSFVSLTPDGQGWQLGYAGVSNFQDIQLSAVASLDASGANGTIDLRGRRFIMRGGSQIILSTVGVDDADSLTDGSSATASLDASGASSTIDLQGRRFITRGGSQIILSTVGVDDAGSLTDGSSTTGNLIINATESVELVSSVIDIPATNIAVQVYPNTAGDSGNIIINTSRFIIRDGAGISSGTLGQGNAGNLTIDASESVDILGFSLFPSTLSTSTASGAVIDPQNPDNSIYSQGQLGDGGNIVINTRRLTLKDGGQIQAFTGDTTEVLNPDGSIFSLQTEGGRGGNVTINTTESVQITGTGKIASSVDIDNNIIFLDTSSLITTSTGFQDSLLTGSSAGGSIRINTPQLTVTNQGQILVNSFQSSGEAGNLWVNAGSIILDNKAEFIADSSSGTGGNINLRATDFLALRHGSSISANAENNGNGGNITIDTPFIFAVPREDSNISSNAEGGSGGNVNITASGIFGLEFRFSSTPLSDITVSSNFGQSGVFTLNRPDVDPSNELVNAPTDVIDTDNLIVRTCGNPGQLAKGDFTITGRGGLPADPSRNLELWEGLADFGDISPNSSSFSSPIPSFASKIEPETIIEAQGWIVSANGQVILTDRAPSVTPHQSAFSSANCHLGANRPEI